MGTREEGVEEGRHAERALNDQPHVDSAADHKSTHETQRNHGPQDKGSEVKGTAKGGE